MKWVLGRRDWWGSSCFWPTWLFTSTSCRFPDGFEKFSPPILQLDEVDFYYDPKHVIFSRLSVSADLESRICVVWLLFPCSMSWDSPTSKCTVDQPRCSCYRGKRFTGARVRAWTKDFSVLNCPNPPTSQGFPTEMKSLACGTLWILRAVFCLLGLSSEFS